jgi:hypothetical protein
MGLGSKPPGKMSYVEFLNWVRKKLEEGWEVYSCYEAGASGYWLHRELVKLGVKNHLRGQKKALSVVAVPTEEQEEE